MKSLLSHKRNPDDKIEKILENIEKKNVVENEEKKIGKLKMIIIIIMKKMEIKIMILIKKKKKIKKKKRKKKKRKE